MEASTAQEVADGDEDGTVEVLLILTPRRADGSWTEIHRPAVRLVPRQVVHLHDG